MTHDELVARALRWARGTLRCPIAAAEVPGYESADVLAFRWGGNDTHLIECKSSRSDFLRDRWKCFRRAPEMGMGRQRWYFAPPDVITVADLPERWGLATFDGRRVHIERKPEPFHVRNTRAETGVLFTLTRRVTEGWGRRVFGDVAPATVDGDPGPTTSRIIRKQREQIGKLRAELAAERRARVGAERKENDR